MDAVELDRVRIAFSQRGSGPPLVLLHGGFSDGRVWRRQLDDLSADFNVVAWDAPGCGQSSDPHPAFSSLAEYADCLAGFLDALGLAPAHVLGLSFGGGLALELYGRHPRAVRSLVLASAYAGWAGSLPADEVRARLERGQRDADRPAAEWVPEYLDGMFSADTPAAVIDDLRRVMLDTRPPALRSMLRAFAAADLRDLLPRVRVPTLLLYGDADVRAPPAVARALGAGIARAELVLLSGVGHCSNLEAPDRFNAEVRRFLRAVEGGVAAPGERA